MINLLLDCGSWLGVVRAFARVGAWCGARLKPAGLCFALVSVGISFLPGMPARACHTVAPLSRKLQKLNVSASVPTFILQRLRVRTKYAVRLDAKNMYLEAPITFHKLYGDSLTH